MKRQKAEKVEVNRFASASFRCPFCGAVPGAPCIDHKDGHRRDRTHDQRYALALRNWRLVSRAEARNGSLEPISAQVEATGSPEAENGPTGRKTGLA